MVWRGGCRGVILVLAILNHLLGCFLGDNVYCNRRWVLWVLGRGHSISLFRNVIIYCGVFGWLHKELKPVLKHCPSGKCTPETGLLNTEVIKLFLYNFKIYENSGP